MTAICVGGIADGKTFEYFGRIDPEFEVPVLEPLVYTPDAVLPKTADVVRRDRYGLRKIRSGEFTFAIFGLASMKDHEVLAMLIDGYRKPKKDKFVRTLTKIAHKLSE